MSKSYCKIAVHNLQNNTVSYMCSYEFYTLLRDIKLNLFRYIHSNIDSKDKIFMYCFRYTSTRNLKAAIILNKQFTELEYKKYLTQLVTKYKHVKPYILKGSDLNAKEIYSKLTK